MRVYRSRSMKRSYVKTPKRTVLHFRKKREGQHRCAQCGAPLHGVKGGSHPSRKYGGYLCHNCLRKKLVESVRV